MGLECSWDERMVLTAIRQCEEVWLLCADSHAKKEKTKKKTKKNPLKTKRKTK